MYYAKKPVQFIMNTIIYYKLEDKKYEEFTDTFPI